MRLLLPLLHFHSSHHLLLLRLVADLIDLLLGFSIVSSFFGLLPLLIGIEALHVIVDVVDDRASLSPLLLALRQWRLHLSAKLRFSLSQRGHRLTELVVLAPNLNGHSDSDKCQSR